MQNKQIKESIAYLDKATAERLVEFLHYSGIADAECTYDELNGSYNVLVPQAQFQTAKNLFDTFSDHELEEDAPDAPAGTPEVTLYESTDDKYKDNLSSAITFLLCGCAGFVILLLNGFNILHLLPSDNSSFLMMNLLMGALFAFFLVIGILSLRYSLRLRAAADAEKQTSAMALAWLRENLSREQIEQSYEAGNIPEEMKYFNRTSCIKKAVLQNFTDITEKNAELIGEQYTNELFPANTAEEFVEAEHLDEDETITSL